MLSFGGRVVVITGAGGALGKAYAKEFAKRGALLLINDVGATTVAGGGDTSQTAAAAVVKEILSGGGKAVANYNNVATEGAEIIEAAMKSFGRVDVLVNNAGILRDKSFHKLEKHAWESVLEVHLEGTFSLCHAVWPHMQANNFGRIINIGSGAGLYGNFGQANYSAAKMGIVGLTSTLAKEGAKHNINVNCVVPIAGSRMTATVLPPSMLALLEPEHIAPLVSLLCHESCTLSGDIFEVGGGWYSQVKMQRSAGASLGSAGHIASAEEIMQGMPRIQDFTAGATYPTTAADALRDMMAAASAASSTSSSRVSPTTTTAAAATPTASATSSAGKSVLDPPALQSDALFRALGEHLASSSAPPLVRSLVEFALEDAGGRVIKKWVLDGRGSAPIISLLRPTEAAPVKPACSIMLTEATFLQLTRGELSTEWAYARGFLKVQGSMGVALKMKTVLDLAGKLATKDQDQEK